MDEGLLGRGIFFNREFTPPHQLRLSTLRIKDTKSLMVPKDRDRSVAAHRHNYRRRSWRSFARQALSEKAQILLHHWSDGCRCCGGVRAHVTGKSCFGSPSLPVA